ncbi:ASCH domain-containing protein [Amazonocrinis nigriterrae]|uniref:hypothetical protein n=1 Tax=Amazonocrinis nigriterrae TaxID=2840443 RepID=UPI001CEC6E48
MRQPHASLIGIHKWFETKNKKNNYRGTILIHAAVQHEDTELHYNQLADLLPPFEELVFGAIVAVAELTDCILMTEEFISQQSETEIRCGLWKPGRYAWKLENVQILSEPIPARGMLGLWDIELLSSQLSVVSQESLVSLKQSNIKIDLYICDRSSNIGIIKSCCSTYFVVDWKTEKNKWYFWERDELYIAELGIAPQHLIDQFLEDKAESAVLGSPQVEQLSKTSESLVLCPSCESQHIYLSGGCGMCGLEPDMQRTQQLQGVQVGQRVRILKTRTKNLEGWIGREATVTGIDEKTISVAAGEGREKKHLTLKHGWYEVIPENFLEENQEAVAPTQQSKPSKQKGCLYRYLENKKLKDGTIASYPRVIGDRKSDNPHHWRWGFNWEEKVDGEWKGRSLGSIPVGAIPMIQSMQNEGVPLEEIIGFIRRSKAKKS